MKLKKPYFGLTKPVTLPFWLCWLLMLALLLCTAENIRSIITSPTTTHDSSFESQVRTWASDYPTDIRDRWAWCYLDSSRNWSTDQKLREDVRLKSVQVLSDSERTMLIPLDRQIAEAIPMQKTPLKETYEAVGLGLRVHEWTPAVDGRQQTVDGKENVPTPAPQPPNRRRIFNRR